jgi:hypothetical protein
MIPVPTWLCFLGLLLAPVSALAGVAAGVYFTQLVRQGKVPLQGLGEAVARRFRPKQEEEPESNGRKYVHPPTGRI